MTFYLDPVDPTRVTPRGPDRQPSNMFEGLAAASRMGVIESNANGKLGRVRIGVRDDLARQALDRIGLDGAQEIFVRQNERARQIGMPSQVRGIPATVDEAISTYGPNFAREVLKMARTRAGENPDEWSDIDLSEEAIEAETNRRIQAEMQDARDIVDMMPSGQTTAEIAGGMAGATLDIRNAPFLLLGGGSGSLIRIMGREALLNMTAETVTLPSRFDMAERLEAEDPDVAEIMLMSAGAGAILGFGAEALARGVRLFKGRSSLPQAFPGYDMAASEAMVDAAEDIIASNEPFFLEEALRIQDQVRPDPPFADENPINPDRPPLLPRDRQEPPLGDDVADEIRTPEIETTPLPATDGDPISDEDLISGIRAAIDDAKAADSSDKRPLVSYIQRSGKEDESLKIHPDGFVGTELKARGVTPRNAPGLFSRNGRKDLDNLPADEWENTFPGILDATGTERGSLYLDRDGFVDVLRRDIEGDSSWLRTRAEVQRLEAELDAAERFSGRTATDDFLDFDQENSAFFINIEDYEFQYGNMAPDQIARDFDTYLNDNGFVLLPQERAEILEELQTRGGDPEYLVERVYEREADFARAKDETAGPEDTPPAKGDQGSGRDPERSEPVAGQADGGQPRPSGLPDAYGQTEVTPAGEQFVTPGVEPVTQRRQLEERQNAILGGGDSPADFGLFDVNARGQADLFDEPGESSDLLTAKTEDIRDVIGEDGAGDFAADIPLEDGRILASASDALEYLDEGDAFSARIDLCGKGPS